MKVIDLKKELKGLQLQYFTDFSNPFVKKVEAGESSFEKNQIKEELIKRYRKVEDALKRYLELSDRLHESNARTHIEVLGYSMTVQTAHDILKRNGLDDFTKFVPNVKMRHPLVWLQNVGTLSDLFFDSCTKKIDPMHLCDDILEKADPVLNLKMELKYAIMKSDCATDV